MSILTAFLLLALGAAGIAGIIYGVHCIIQDSRDPGDEMTTEERKNERIRREIESRRN